MKTTVLLFHPSLASSRVNQAWARAATDLGIEVRDMCALYPDFRIDVEREQQVCERADRLVFQHPFHWYAPPALMKKWIDDVLKFGWAYGDRYALEGKRWVHAITVGAALEEYGRDGNRRYEIDEFLRPLERTAAFCRMEWQPPHVLCGAGYIDEVAINESASEYGRWLIGSA